MIDLKLLKFLHKLNASKLPQYFNSYKPYLEKNETKYNLRPNPLVMPAVNHVYAENLLIYRLVKLKNMFSLHYPLVDDKLNDGTHSGLAGGIYRRYLPPVFTGKYRRGQYSQKWRLPSFTGIYKYFINFSPNYIVDSPSYLLYYTWTP